jgi:hypothetical protein
MILEGPSRKMCSHVYGQLNDKLASSTLVFFVHFLSGAGGKDTARVPPAPNLHPLTFPAFLCGEGKAKLYNGMFVCL